MGSPDPAPPYTGPLPAGTTSGGSLNAEEIDLLNTILAHDEPIALSVAVESIETWILVRRESGDAN
jgi:hypothetical protein